MVCMARVSVTVLGSGVRLAALAPLPAPRPCGNGRPAGLPLAPRPGPERMDTSRAVLAWGSRVRMTPATGSWTLMMVRGVDWDPAAPRAGRVVSVRIRPTLSRATLDWEWFVITLPLGRICWESLTFTPVSEVPGIAAAR